MKINKFSLRKTALAVASFILLGFGTSCADLWSEQHPGTYYTNNGETVADYLTGRVEYHGDYSYFIAILQKAELWGQLRTYGAYTCFAPDDSAIQAYIDLRYAEASDSLKPIFQSLETVLQNRKLCDTIARTHIFANVMYASDLSGNGVLQHPNLLDRYVTYSSAPDSSRKAYDANGNVIKAADGSDSVLITLKYIINMQAELVTSDDSVQNGVVHRINKVLRSSNQFLPGLMKENPNLTIFYSALLATGLKDTLEKYYDDNYPEIEYEWTQQALRDNYGGIHKNETAYETGDNADRIAYPEKREFKFTIFVMPDTALATYSDKFWPSSKGGINDLNDLREYAKTVYPEGAALPDTVRGSSLNKLLSYHILPCWLSYDQFNTRQKGLIGRRLALKEYDVEDFFETLMPHSVMRISTPYPSGTNENPLGIFINRKGTQEIGIQAEGIRIAEDISEYNLPGSLTNICVNGQYHYVNKLLTYDSDTRENALQCRMRIMCCTLSPDFINSGGRGRLNGEAGVTNIDKMAMAYMPGFCQNFVWVPDQTKFFVRYRDTSFGTVYGDEITVRGSYDLAFKLPPVPTDGNYEIRIWNNSLASSANNDRGIAQFYFHQYNPTTDDMGLWRNWDWEPEGIPVDIRVGGGDARIGMVADDDERYDNMTAAQKSEAIYQNDRAMRIRGYMKAVDSYTSSWSDNKNSGAPIRNDMNCYRKIICNEYLRADNDYYIRMRQVWEEDGVYPFSFIEIVPKSVYEGNEDQH